MPDLILALVFLQAVGAFIGAASAVWSEIAYIKAARDGSIDRAERAHIHAIAQGLKLGMSVLLFASLGLVVIAFLLEVGTQPALTSGYWILVNLALLIIAIAWALSKRRIAFSLGSAIIFTAWWFIAYLTIGWLPLLTFGSAFVFFIVAVTVFYAVLSYNRFLVLRK